MPTLGYLKSKIADDLHRSDLTTQISDAVDNSIRRYSRERFWFLEGTATITLAASTSSYELPSDFKAIDSVLISRAGIKEPITQVSYNDMDEDDDGTFEGIPTEYAIYGSKIRFYPTPDSANSTTISYHKGLDTPSASTSNAWTNAAFDLIRYSAEKEIYRNILRNADMAMMSKDGETEAFDSLRHEHITRTTTGRLRKGGI